MRKAALKTFYTGLFALILGCFSIPQGMADYKPKKAHSGKSHADRSCLPEQEQNVSVQMSEQDKKRLKLANAYMNYRRAQGEDTGVIKSLYQASVRTGVDFEVLLMKASMESDMGKFTAAARSSARGLFQYIEPTWLILIDRYGEQMGFGEYAKAIQISRKRGFPYFKGNDKYLRSEILALRYDDDISALVKAYQIMEETDVIRGYKKGKKVTVTDHYIAHMMGLNLAKDFYDLMNTNSILVVARLRNPQMREAAMLNKAFFYNRKHQPLTAKLAYAEFQKRVDREIRKIRNIEKYNSQPPCVFADARVN